jgi:hypothetical protein
MPRRRGERTEHTPLDLLRRTFGSLSGRAFVGWPVRLESARDLYEPWGLDVEGTVQEVVVWAEPPDFEASEPDVQPSGNLLIVRVGR